MHQKMTNLQLIAASVCQLCLNNPDRFFSLRFSRFVRTK